MRRTRELVDRLEETRSLPPEELVWLLEQRDLQPLQYLFDRARAVADGVYGKRVFARGLIEFTNYCKNDCYYCGIRRSNRNAERYRLSEDEILVCCRVGHSLGFRSFVLQGGEDGRDTDASVVSLLQAIKAEFSDCAVTLSIGERSRESYKSFFDAGADRYLLRHETANDAHYAALHPPGLTLAKRKDCLLWLKEIGFQVGCGFMVGSPGQTTAHLLEDLQFIREFQPHMVGIGPYIPHPDTPFAGQPAGSLPQTLILLAIVRLMLPEVLLPSTTALGTIHPEGRERGVLAGANVVMPNLSPQEVRAKYLLYENKISTGSEAAEGLRDLARRMEQIGYQLATTRGDHISAMKK